MSKRKGVPKRVIFFAILFIVTIWVTIFPLGLPVYITTQSKDFVNALNKLQPGNVVVLGNTFSDLPVDTRTAWKAVFSVLFQKHVKLIIVNLVAGSDAAAAYMVNYGGTPGTYNYVYGTDYVIMPYLPGDELAMSGVANNFRQVYSTDYYGTPIDNLPVLNGITGFKQVDLAIVNYNYFTYGDMFVRQWAVPFKPIIVWGSFYGIAAYYGKYVVGDIDILKSMAEFELIVGIPGEELSRLDCQNLQGLVVLLAIWIPASLNALGKEEWAKKFGSGEKY